MAPLIDNTYFTGEIMIPNMNVISTDITQAIGQYEPEILLMLLGYKTLKHMLLTPTVEPYKSLIEGAEFEMEVGGEMQLMKWIGLRNSIKQSLIAYYIFYKYVERNFITMSGVGAVTTKAANAQRENPYFSKMVNAWNRMIDLYGCYPPATGRNRLFAYGAHLSPEPTASALNYLIANSESFPYWQYTPLSRINQFGI